MNKKIRRSLGRRRRRIMKIWRRVNRDNNSNNRWVRRRRRNKEGLDQLLNRTKIEIIINIRVCKSIRLNIKKNNNNNSKLSQKTKI